MLKAETIATIKAITPAVAAQAESLTRAFYQRMFRENPEVQAFFNQAHQHSGGQQRALAGAIVAYFAHIDNPAALEAAVELIAQKHCSLQIKAEHYPIVGKHLLAAVAEVFGEAASPAVLGAVGEAYQALARIFIDREQQIYDEQRRLEGGWNGYRSFVVTRKVAESDLVTSFYLKPADQGALPVFKAGQYITLDVSLPTTATSPRNYSLSDRPGSDALRISVKRERSAAGDGPDGLVSNHLHDNVGEGDCLRVGAPCGEFTLNLAAEAQDRPVLFIAGGIGITPLLSMVKDLLSRGFKPSIHMLQAARNGQIQAFGQELRQLAGEHANLEICTVFDDPAADDLTHGLCDRVGFVTADLLRGFPIRDAEIYFCGPAGFMRGVHASLVALGVEPERMHFEFFGPRQELAQAAG